MLITKLAKTGVIATTLSLVVMRTSTVPATTTVCSTEASRLHHYGDKGSIRFTTPRADPDSITDAVKVFADKNGFSYSSAGGFDPYKKPAFRSLDWWPLSSHSGHDHRAGCSYQTSTWST
jgi:hypothetical protein